MDVRESTEAGRQPLPRRALLLLLPGLLLLGLAVNCVRPHPPARPVHSDAATPVPSDTATPVPSDTELPIRSDTELPALLCFTNVERWHVESAGAEASVRVSPRLETRTPWNELIVSWNVQPADHAGLSIEARGLRDHQETRYYGLGHWSLGDSPFIVRTSQSGESDADGVVRTDTLVLHESANGVQLRLTLHGELTRHPERLRLVSLSLTDTRFRPEPRPADRTAWGHVLDVPERSQVAYADGRAWCSPTSVSMMLAWWARELGRAELDRDVPEVARGVDDPAWPGTGNWPFNTAYAGSFDGLTACVARLRDLRALEELVAAGIPAVLSVNAPVLRGKPPAKDGGHLILCVGFTESGDVVANDPWARLGEGQRVRRIYPRANVERAWEHAHHLVYLIAPSRLRAAFPAEWR